MDYKLCATHLCTFSALAYASLYGVSFTIIALVIREESYLSPYTIFFYSFLGTFCFTLPSSVPHLPHGVGSVDNQLLLLARAIFNILDNGLAMACFKYLPLAKSMVVVSSVPAFSPIFARLLLKEPIERIQIFVAILALTGVILTTDPHQLVTRQGSTDSQTALGLCCGIASVLSCCVSLTCTRKMKDVPAAILNLTSSLVGVATAGVALIAANADYLPRCGFHRLTPVALGLLTFLGQTFMIWALQEENVGPVVIVSNSTQILLGVALHVLVSGERMEWLCAVGVGVTLVAVVLIGFRSWIVARPEQDRWKTIFKSFLK